MEAADYLSLKPSYVYKLVCLGKLPYHKPNGKKLYFSREKLDRWMLGEDSLDERAATYLNTHR